MEKHHTQCKIPLISLYNKFNEYCHTNNIEINTLLADGLHPNDAGYDIMFNIIMSEIGIAL